MSSRGAGTAAVIISPVTGKPRLVDPRHPHVGLEDQALTRGDGVFETLHVLDGDAYKFDAHHARLSASARSCDLLAPTAATCRAALAMALDAAGPGSQDPALGLGAEHSVKLSISRGAPGDAPWAWLTAAPVPDSTFAARRDGVSVRLLNRGHDPAEDSGLPWLLPGVKTLSYAVNMAALRYARDHGADDVVFTSADGYLLEGPTSTVLIVRTGEDGVRRLLTPLRQKGILAGTSQAVIFAAAHADGWELGYGPLVPADLQGAEGVWLVSSVRGVLPVRAVDGVEIPVDHELTGMLQAHLDADGDPGRHVSGDPVPTAG